ncbi:MAG: hypothetical protein EA352_01415 [Gemmatimonadales bacterium]|nr:MAG: hypothetical protein EA352_01415 [Gemmatimonadales bacterium]
MDSTPLRPAHAWVPLLWALLLAGVLGWLISLPDRVVRGGGGPWVASEALVLSGLVAMAPRLLVRGWQAWLTGGVLLFLVLLALADGTTRMSQGRPLDLPEDILLLRAVTDLLTGSIGGMATGVVILGAAVLCGLILLGVARGIRQWPDTPLPVAGALLVAAGILLAVPHGLGAGGSSGEGPEWTPGASGTPVWNVAVQVAAAPTVRVARTQWELRAEQGRAGAEKPPPVRPLPGLEGRDLVLAFIESYGVSATHDDRYAPVVRPRLESLAGAARDRGFHLVSGMLEAPVVGGRSWLAHATTLSGVRISRQDAYRELLEAEGPTLARDLRATGHRTVALLPALIRDWPEGGALGWDAVRTAGEGMEYDGPALHWATMPDQFVWWRMEESERRSPDRRPLFVLLAPVSSHAPWTPVLPILDDWEGLGRGEVFREWEDAGPAPVELWRDFDAVREQYALSIDYALGVAEEWVRRYMDDATLLVVLGDHQPTPVITGEGASADVPVHVFAADRVLLRPFLELGFTEGVLPDADPRAPPGTSPGLEAIRPALHRAFAAPGRQPEATDSIPAPRRP